MKLYNKVKLRLVNDITYLYEKNIIADNPQELIDNMSKNGSEFVEKVDSLIVKERVKLHKKITKAIALKKITKTEFIKRQSIVSANALEKWLPRNPQTLTRKELNRISLAKIVALADFAKSG